MFAMSFAVVALSACALLLIFGRQSNLFARFARTGAAAEPASGRTRRAGDGLVYHPPIDADPVPVLAPAPMPVPLGLSPAHAPEIEDDDAWAEEGEPAAPLPVSPLAAGHADDEEEEYDEPESDVGFASLGPELAAHAPVRADPLAFADDEPEEEPEPEIESAATPLVTSLPELPAGLEPEPVNDWPETATQRLHELDALIGAGGFAAYFAEISSPHHWDEMIEALRSVGAGEAAEVAIDAGEVQWPYHEQGGTAPAEAFADADARWAALGVDLPALLAAWRGA
ncbi:MAG: hypothetical protein J7500_00800 [Sphingomonas sp.]|uniref:DMP19 family protein n=1 Tax=Sphingomonas sp. TaxID=28214 RepID=UPI001B0BA6D0|nr:hypothetical protein [Sphingomonas sp.]MBO9621227.1 hypothetical protein [Sphingomonas sp.]